jgi:hypothetical protein
VVRDGDFVDVPNRPVTTVRTPADAVARTVDQVAGDELAAGLSNLVRDAGTVTQDDLTAAAARLFGWTRRGPEITTRLDYAVAALVAAGTLDGDKTALVQDP